MSVDTNTVARSAVNGRSTGVAPDANAPSGSQYVPPSRQRLSLRAEEYLLTHLDQPVSIHEICQAVGAASRTLHVAFQECLGISPKRYSRELRLEAVRRELVQPGPGTTVTEVAMRWGFSHLGRFSQSYRQRFGESPSLTLRAAICATQSVESTPADGARSGVAA